MSYINTNLNLNPQIFHRTGAEKYKNYKKNFLSLKTCVKVLKEKYDFKGLWHFTDFGNLQNIFDRGELCSRQECIDENIEFVDGANHEVLDKASEFVHSSTRFYYRPKTPTLYKNEGIKPEQYCNKVHIPRPVYLLFSEELIYNKDTWFSNGNATNSEIGNTYSFFKEMDWKNIFHHTYFSPSERNNIINKRQAEVLSENPVDLKKYLKKIIFRCNADLKEAIRIWGNDERYEVNPEYFNVKIYSEDKKNDYNNYIKDFQIKVKNNKTNLCLEFAQNIRDYKINLKLYKDEKEIRNVSNKELEKLKKEDKNNKEVDNLFNAKFVKMAFPHEKFEGCYLKVYVNNFLCFEYNL